MTQLYPWALCSLFVASYDSQGYGGGILTRLHTGTLATWSWSSSCGRQSVDQCRLGIGPPFGTLDQILACSSFFV
jgi:hypothetical protein